MKTYKITLKRHGIFDLPATETDRKKLLPAIVLNELEAAEYVITEIREVTSVEMELPDDFHDVYGDCSLLVLKLPLPQHATANNPAAYRYCVEALTSGFLGLEYAREVNGHGYSQSIIAFRVEEEYVDMVFEDYETVRNYLDGYSR